MSDRLTDAEHAALRERLPDLLGPHRLGPADRELTSHVEACPACRARLVRLRRVHALLTAAEPAPEPSAGLAERIAAIPLRAQDAPAPRRNRRALLAGLAAAAAVAVGAVAIVTIPGDPSGPEFEAPMALSAADSGISVAVAMGSGSGDQMPMRITASGLTPGEQYSLWLTGQRGEVLVETFRPDKGGDCQVIVTAPSGDWTRAVVRADDGPGDLVIASSTI